MIDILHELLEDSKSGLWQSVAKAAQTLYAEAAQLCLTYSIPYNTIRVLMYPKGLSHEPRCPIFCSVLEYNGSEWSIPRALAIKGPPMAFGASFLWVEGERPKELKSKKWPKQDIYKVPVMAWKEYQTRRSPWGRLYIPAQPNKNFFITRWELLPTKEKRK